jgi:hypothetical protein
MTRDAASAGFEQFLGDAVDATREEFSVERALRGTGLGPGGRLVDGLRSRAEALEKRVVEPELATYRDRSLAQFEVVLDAVEAGEDIDAVADDVLAADSYVEALEPEAPQARRDSLTDAVLARNRRLAGAVEPVVARPEDEFWPAVEAALDREQALALVEEAFPFTEALRDHRDVLTFETRIDPGEVVGGTLGRRLPSVGVEYTDEAVRAMTRAERRVIHEARREVDRRFGGEA